MLNKGTLAERRGSVLNKLKNKRGFNQIVTAMILLGVAAAIALAVVSPFKGSDNPENPGLPGASKTLVQQIEKDITGTTTTQNN